MTWLSDFLFARRWSGTDLLAFHVSLLISPWWTGLLVWLVFAGASALIRYSWGRIDA